MTIGTRIKQLRKQQSLSLKDLSEKIDISVSFLSDIENNRSNPSLDRVKDIAKGLNTTVSYLLNEDTSALSNGREILQSDKTFQYINGLLQGFSDWPDEDKTELLHYLQAKKIIRGFGE